MKNLAKKAAKKARIANLELRLFESRASQAAALGFAFDALGKAAGAHMGGGLVLTLTALGGKELFAPVVLRDGIGPDTIRALQKEVVKSFEIATLVNPAMGRLYQEGL